MPRLPAISVPSLRRLEADLRNAPRETLLRDVERAEDLARDVETQIEYPTDWIVFRVTGHRPDEVAAKAGTPETVRGDRLLADLSALAERLCVRARLRHDELASDIFLSATALGKLWKASPATLKRWRRAGLVSRRVIGPSGRAEVWVSRLSAEAFRVKHANRVTRAEKFERLTPQARADALTRAAALRAQGMSLHQAARTLAKELNRSTEGLRHLLKSSPTFQSGRQAKIRATDRTDDSRRRAALVKQWRSGADPTALARAAHKSVPLTRRDINLARADELRAWHDAGAFTVPHTELDPSSLSHPAVTTGLGTPWEPTLAESLTAWRKRPADPRDREHARAHAFHALRARAAAALATVDPLHPSAHTIDEAETALRWAGLLRRDLLRSQHRLILDTLETRAGNTLNTLPPAATIQLITEAVTAAAGAVDHFDPSKGGRLAGQVALAVDKVAVRLVRSLEAAARDKPPSPHAPTWESVFSSLSAWDAALLPNPRIARAIASGSLPRPTASLLTARFGLAGEPPRTLTQIVKSHALTPIAAARSLQRAIALAIRAADGAAPSIITP